MPGSPATSTIDPKTIPPPNTLFNSASALLILFSDWLLTSLIAITCVPFCCVVYSSQPDSFFSPFSTNSSVKVFHSFQAGHFPAHFADSYPQLLQKKADLALLIP